MILIKTNTLPAVLQGDTMYLVKSTAVGKLNLYVTNAEATEVRAVLVDSFIDSTNGTAVNLFLDGGYREKTVIISGTAPSLTPSAGTMQKWSLTANSTPTIGSFLEGQSLMLMIDDGTARTINWGSAGITWKTNSGAAPTLLTTGLTPIVLWKLDNILYGARVGDA